MTNDDCKTEAGTFAPLINRNRCEAKGDCVEVCPYQVFAIQSVNDDDKRALGLFSKFKLWLHRGRQAYAVRAEDCHACGLCVNACPEHAISLRRLG